MRSTHFLPLSFAGAIAIALFAFACGGSSSSGTLDGGNGNDGGGGGCSGGPPPGRCITGCNGATTGEQCINGQWTCPPEPEIACFIDAGDDGSSGDDGGGSNDGGNAGDGGIDCVTITCNAATQYCDIRGGGAQPLDGGSNMSYTCPALPTMPCDAGTGCACIPNKCSCTDDGGSITNECLFP